ncbi:MAG: pyrrolo-quinoline quinone, partial [Planctomycetes bacterium]|nr:pyrrolo-quinoline quinone [Planctomycetota bacterium]
QKPSADERPAPPREADVKTDPKPAQLQLVPVESLLKPGESQQFSVRLYNSRGQFLHLVDAKDVKFSISGPGAIDKSGTYSTPDPLAKKQHTAIAVTATVKGLSGKARIRLVPDLPWNIDFNDGRIPATWVGARYRHIPLNFTLYKKLEKEKKSLLAARLYIFLQTGMVNGQPTNRRGLPGFQDGKLVYNNRSPKRTFAALTQYLGLEEKTATLDNAKKELDPLLKLLAEEKIIGKHVWSTETGIQLVIDKVTPKIDGEGVMVKIKTIPKGQRSQGWMGHPDFFNYTIQADVLGAERVSSVQQGTQKFTVRKMPDIGLAGQRYVLDLMGAKQQLQIRTWHAQKRMSKSAPFTWKPNVWYTLKLKVSVVGGRAHVFAKCWERGKKEPVKWMLEATDETPNENGSPGLYGNAVDAEIFYDNMKVYKNK